MTATDTQVRDLARTIAAQAQAIADGTLTGPVHATARLVRSNADTLAAWTAPPAATASDAARYADAGRALTEEEQHQDCPVCKAAPGRRCRLASSTSYRRQELARELKHPHRERTTAWARATAERATAEGGGPR